MQTIFLRICYQGRVFYIHLSAKFQVDPVCRGEILYKKNAHEMSSHSDRADHKTFKKYLDTTHEEFPKYLGLYELY